MAAPWRAPRAAAPAAGCSGVECARSKLEALERGIGAVARTSRADLAAGFALAVPVVALFNVVASARPASRDSRPLRDPSKTRRYSSEKSVKERFVLRSALAHEHNHDVRVSLLARDAAATSVRRRRARDDATRRDG